MAGLDAAQNHPRNSGRRSRAGWRRSPRKTCTRRNRCGRWWLAAANPCHIPRSSAAAAASHGSVGAFVSRPVDRGGHQADWQRRCSLIFGQRFTLWGAGLAPQPAAIRQQRSRSNLISETDMPEAKAMNSVLDRIDADLDNSLDRLFALLRIKSISADPAFAADCKQAADHVAQDLTSIGFATEVRPTAGHPAVVGKLNGKSNAPHVLFYGHYDVQPVDPLNLWRKPPFDPVIDTDGNGRKIIVARGAEDDKGQLMTFVEACRAWKAATGSIPLNITMIIEGEEEVGSKNFVPFLKANKKELAADFALVCDTGMWDRQTPAITTSLRGLVYEEVVIKAANRDLHSGVFGGGARNPIRVLTSILGKLQDDKGHITIPHFYDGVKDLPKDVLEQWKSLNLSAETFLKPIGLSIPAGEKDPLLIEQISSRPTCDINGIVGGYTGEGSKTVIAAQASAKISFRLVPGQDPKKIRDNFRKLVAS